MTVLSRRNLKHEKDRPVRFDLAATNLRGADAPGIDLAAANLDGAQLQGANLYRGQLQHASLDGAQLQGANLSGAQLQEARLTGTQLQRAHLNGAQLDGAWLDDAQLQNASLDGARLESALLNGAQLKGARTTDATTWPAGFFDAEDAELRPTGYEYVEWDDRRQAVVGRKEPMRTYEFEQRKALGAWMKELGAQGSVALAADRTAHIQS